MPLLRYEIRNEYSLANLDLWQATTLKDDPEGIAEGVAMAGLVGIVRQLGDMAEFAAELFHQLHEEVMSTAARGHGLLARVQQLETELPTFEKMLASQTKELQLVYTQGLEWHATVHNDQNHVTQGDLPRFIRNSYEECRGPPMLFLLDKFDGDGDGACLKRYTDPSFFKLEWASSELSKAKKHLQDRKTQRIRRKGRRHTPNGALSKAINVSQMKPRVPYTLLEVTKPVFNEDHVKATKEVKQVADANGSCSDASIHGPRDENDIKAYWEAEAAGLSDNSTNGEANVVPIDDMDEVFNKNEFSNTEKRGGFSDRNESVKDAELEGPRYEEIIEEQEKFEDALVTIDSEIETDFESIANKLDMDSEAFPDDDVEWYSDAREGEGSLSSDTKGDASIKSRHATIGVPILSQPSFNAEEDLISIQPHIEVLEPFEIKERKMTSSLCLNTDGFSSSDESIVDALHRKSERMRSSPILSIYQNENEDGSEEGEGEEEDVLDDSDDSASVCHVSESLSSLDMGQKEDHLSSLFHILPEPAILILNGSDSQRIPDLGALSLHKRDPEASGRVFLSMEKNGNQEETLSQASSSDSFEKPILSMMQDHCIDDDDDGDDEDLATLSLHKRDLEALGRETLSMEKDGNQEEILSQASSSDSFNKSILSTMQDHCIEDDNDDDDDDEDLGTLSLHKQDPEALGRDSLSMEKNGNQEETLSQASSLDSFDRPILSMMQDHCIDDDDDDAAATDDDDDDDDGDNDDDDEDDDIDAHQATSESSSSSSLMLPSPHSRTNLLPDVLSPALESTLTLNHSLNFEADCIGDVAEERPPIPESSLNVQSPKESPPLPPLPPLKWRSMKSCISTQSLSPCDNSISPSKDLLTPLYPPPPSQPQSVPQPPIAPVIERADFLNDDIISYDRNVLQSVPRQPIVPVIKKADSLADDITSYDRNALRKVVKQISLPQQKPSDDRESLLEQIRTRSFNLRRTIVEKHETPRPVPNINVAAILEKANAIRQAFAGSDDEDVDDDWSDD